MKRYRVKYLKDGIEKTDIFNFEKIDKSQLPKGIIEIKEIKYSFDDLFKKRLNAKELNFLFYELNLMLQSNISFNNALNILIKNKRNKNSIEFLKALQYSFTSLKPIEIMLEQFYIDNLIISFLKVCQNSGNISVNIKALSELLIENSQIKKAILNSISYPIMLIITFFISLISIFYFVIPKFEIIFSQFQNNLPIATKVLLFVQDVFQNYLFFVIGSIVSLFMIVYFFVKKNEYVNFYVHRFLVKKMPLLKDIFLNMELYKFFFLINILLNSKYEFHKALNYSKVLLNNKYVLDKIMLIEDLLNSGEQINIAFKKSGLFDDIVLNLINTGEVSNSLIVVSNDIKIIYKNRFDEKINSLINLMQPIFLVLIMAMILWLVLAIFMPIWDMGNLIKV